MEQYKVLVACLQRFHIFNQASELNKLGYLKLLIQGYPKFVTRRWKFPDNKIIFTAFEGFTVRLLKFFPKSLKRELIYFLHESFDGKVARSITSDFNFFIGLSSYSLESLKVCSQYGIVKIVDHGSLHPCEEIELLKRECDFIGIDYFSLNAHDERLVQRQINEFELSDQVMVLSKASKNSLVKFGVPSNKIFINGCGVDLKQFNFNPQHKNKFKIIFCGAIDIHKGVHHLVKAFTELKLPNSELLLIGRSSNKIFNDYLNKLNLNNVKFHGAVRQRELPNLYSQGSVFVLPSIYDGFGMVVPQAMACGLPVVVSSNVGAADIIEHGKNGFIFKKGDVESLKSMLLQLYEDHHLLEAISAESVKISLASLSWNRYGRRLAGHLAAIKNEYRI